jgi:hypothetical protein
MPMPDNAVRDDVWLTFAEHDPATGDGQIFIKFQQRLLVLALSPRARPVGENVCLGKISPS